ncbi:MAG: endolytic transglycosylase MltG, partial [Clostridia bacterium]|nr:endolytic transglycosylase MltG [Clostridia bacterium]
MKRNRLLLLIVVCTLLFSGCDIKGKLVEPVDPNNGTEVMFTVPAGASTTKIATLLKEENLIKSEQGFKFLSKDLGADGKMQAGDYMLSPSMSSEAIINKLVAGDTYVETVMFTIPEGYEIRNIVDYLEGEGLIEREAFLKALAEDDFDNDFLSEVNRGYHLEGYLFPDTYEIKVGAT